MKHTSKLLLILVLILDILIAYCITIPQDVYAKESPFKVEEAEIVLPETEEIEIDEKAAIAEQYEELMAELDTTPDLLNWYLKYKDFTENLEDAPETIYDYYTEDELNKIFGVVQAEIGSQYYTFEQRCNVASVIFNRIGHHMFGDDVESVLTRTQFSTVANGAYRNEPTELTILACEFAFAIADTTDGCIGFKSGSKLNTWNGWELSFYDGAHYFYKIKE